MRRGGTAVIWVGTCKVGEYKCARDRSLNHTRQLRPDSGVGSSSTPRRRPGYPHRRDLRPPHAPARGLLARWAVHSAGVGTLHVESLRLRVPPPPSVRGNVGSLSNLRGLCLLPQRVTSHPHVTLGVRDGGDRSRVSGRFRGRGWALERAPPAPRHAQSRSQ